jgi:hypothetical protein
MTDAIQITVSNEIAKRMDDNNSEVLRNHTLLVLI